ncbi:uncharacterized protein LOC123314131 [Coccinella septempunctata]|uniref:uncharacterized protein LOC123314131 n=1 Tax=Coccinella septempunctata TaxID=41139 RepID=UPI001D067B3F|nr:uncharacterized protein LOC123314131 [Coccinella septempunctata]
MTDNDHNTPNNVISRFKFPYIPHLSHRVSRLFKNLKNGCAYYNLSTTKRFFTQLKHKTPSTLESEVVYKIACQNCHKCYVGQTKQYLKERIRQHKRDCEDVANYNKTAVTHHQMTTGHKFDFDNVEILDREKNGYRRNISEMIQIRRNNTVNHREDVEHLSIIYSNLMDD